MPSVLYCGKADLSTGQGASGGKAGCEALANQLGSDCGDVGGRRWGLKEGSGSAGGVGVGVGVERVRGAWSRIPRMCCDLMM